MIDYEPTIQWLLNFLPGKISGLETFGRVIPSTKTSKKRVDELVVNGNLQFCRIALFNSRPTEKEGNFDKWRTIFQIELWHAYNEIGDIAVTAWAQQIVEQLKSEPTMGGTVESTLLHVIQRTPSEVIFGETTPCSYGTIQIHTDMWDTE